MDYEKSTATMEGVIYSTAPSIEATAVPSEKEGMPKADLERALAKKILGYELTEKEKELLARAEAKGILFGEQ